MCPLIVGGDDPVGINDENIRNCMRVSRVFSNLILCLRDCMVLNTTYIHNYNPIQILIYDKILYRY